ncbi:hypothetical protein AX14_001146 [Amanita brunnescens Koide BX004]|nr:hypothetical protein AX14_001146 [Amanita brunnescens Koide BX004]
MSPIARQALSSLPEDLERGSWTISSASIHIHTHLHHGQCCLHSSGHSTATLRKGRHVIASSSIYPFYIELWRRGLEETYKRDGDLGMDVVEQARGRGYRALARERASPSRCGGAGHF